jgi:hypothetical protein
VYPDSLSQIGVFALFVLPGITYSSVRVALVGWRAPDYGVAARVLDALFASAIFDGIYVLLFGWYVAEVATGRHDPLETFNWIETFVAVFLLIGLPALAGFTTSLRLRFVRRVGSDGEVRRRLARTNNYSSVPLAWDHVAGSLGSGQWVRVRTENGTYYGGWFSGRSYVCTYPQPRDIYIETQFYMRPDGTFGHAVPNGAGIWLPVNDKSIVEWINEPKESSYGNQ